MRVQPKSLKAFFENWLHGIYNGITMEHNLKKKIYIYNCTPEKNIVYFIVIIFVNCMLYIHYPKIYNKYMYA